MSAVRTGAVLAEVEAVPAVVTLRPGEACFAVEPTVVRTVLGSCLAATMHCGRLRAGAICHALFPGGAAGAGADAFRYVDRSIEAMAAWFRGIGARRGEIEVKLFGGAGTSWSGPDAPASVNVGRSNVAEALRSIAAHGLYVAARDVGGTIGRKLYFVSHTGDVFVKRLESRPTADAWETDPGIGPGKER